jgi:hypothetical protein
MTNALITLQRKGGNPTRSGDLKIEFYGHNAFKVTSPAGLTVLTDPWRNDSTGVYPKWFLSEFPAIPTTMRSSGRTGSWCSSVWSVSLSLAMLKLPGSFHVETCPPNNAIGFDNAIQIIETGGLRIAVWGDNRPVPDPSLDRDLRNVDVLILPVETILTRAEADAIVREYHPKTVIPAQYFVSGLMTEVSGLDSADGWVNEQEKVPKLPAST